MVPWAGDEIPTWPDDDADPTPDDDGRNWGNKLPQYEIPKCNWPSWAVSEQPGYKVEVEPLPPQVPTQVVCRVANRVMITHVCMYSMRAMTGCWANRSRCQCDVAVATSRNACRCSSCAVEYSTHKSCLGGHCTSGGETVVVKGEGWAETAEHAATGVQSGWAQTAEDAATAEPSPATDAAAAVIPLRSKRAHSGAEGEILWAEAC